jgi:Family of unknown function (DUF6504)
MCSNDIGGQDSRPVHRRWRKSRPVTRTSTPAVAGRDPPGDREARVSRRYDEPVEVRRRDDEPAEFLWRGRHYAVRAVLAHWVETGAWWQIATGGSGGSAGSVVGSVALVPDLDSLALSAERELWRVEASRGRHFGSGVFELCFDWTAQAGAGWSLVRALD